MTLCHLLTLYSHSSTTAYGAEVSVPGNADILIAGTSCVDYSNLNNEKQDISANGESGRTFRGMMGWVKNHRPPIVILENVCSAPWDKIVVEFERIGYSARNTRFDTKQYYIPHTRTRGYLIAINEKKSRIPDKWLDLVGKMKRPASSTLDAFLLPSDDPRVSQAREKLVRESFNAGDRRTGRTDWNRCESRHKRARVEEELGNKRPFTSWDEGLSRSFHKSHLANFIVIRWVLQDARFRLGRLGARPGGTCLGSYGHLRAPCCAQRSRSFFQNVCRRSHSFSSF